MGWGPVPETTGRDRPGAQHRLFAVEDKKYARDTGGAT